MKKVAVILALLPLAALTPARGEARRASLLAFLREGGDLPAFVKRREPGVMRVLEDLLLSPPKLTRQEFDRLVPRLGAASYRLREKASGQLVSAGVAVLPWIEQAIAKAKDPEIRARLELARTRLGQWSARVDQLERALASLYAAQAEAIWKQRVQGAAGADTMTPRAALFLSMLPVDVLRRQLATMAEQDRLNIILRILFEHNVKGLLLLDEGFGGSGYTRWVDELRRMDAKKVLAACARLWTIELEPPARDGAYYWTYRAERAQDGLATNVIRASIDRGRRGHRIVHFEIYREARFRRSGIGPFLSWKGSLRRGKSWRNPSPPAWKYLKE